MTVMAELTGPLSQLFGRSPALPTQGARVTDVPLPEQSRPGRNPALGRPIAPLDVPEAVVEFMNEAAGGASALHKLGYIARHRKGAVETIGLLRRLPVLTIAALPAVGSREHLLAPLRRKVAFIPTGRLGQSVLEIPSDRPYTAGRSRQALRTNANRARSEGVTVRAIDTDEATQLITAVLSTRGWSEAEVALRVPVEVQPGLRLWAAFDADGDAIAYASIATCGPYARLIGSTARDSDQSPAKWLLHAELITALAAEGCRWYFVDSALKQAKGLSHFQTLCGFIAMNVVIAS